MRRVATLSALLLALAASSAYARTIAPDSDPTPVPVVQDTQPWLVQAVLTATVDADGQVTLTDSKGQPISQLLPGAYSLWIRDWSPTANFHLAGNGVDRSSSLVGTGYDAWRVVLDDGNVRFFSDSAPADGGSFTVAGYRW